LNISINNISDLSSLSQMSNMIFFSANSNAITSISPLLNMPNLRQINLQNNSISNLSDLLVTLASGSISGGYFDASRQQNGRNITPAGEVAIVQLRSRGLVVFT
jgi:Leucine-rich repeat (LRR) protein